MSSTRPGLAPKRRRAEARFRFYGIAALAFAVAMLCILIGSIVYRGYSGFTQTQIRLPIIFDMKTLQAEASLQPPEIPASAYTRWVQAALKTRFPEAREHKDQRQLFALISLGAGRQLKHMLVEHPELKGTTQPVWLTASSLADLYSKGRISADIPEADRKISDQQIGWLNALKHEGARRGVFNTMFFSRGDSRAPEQAGFLGAIIGSGLVLVICLLVVFPIGVMTAVYLEEFARKSRWVDLIDVNINNLAAVPSIVFGLLGLAVYINVMGMPRSGALVGGLTLALMVLPVLIITTRVALKSVPPSIRDAARALGASPLQVVCHHTVPLALPGIMTGTILGLARAIGETAPLLMIGMVAFVADTPKGFLSPATAMPVQIYLWADSPEAGFAEKTAAGILVLLVLLLAMNALAIWLRKRFETRW